MPLNSVHESRIAYASPAEQRLRIRHQPSIPAPSASTTPKPASPQSIRHDDGKLQSAADSINQRMQQDGREIQFQIDRSTGFTVVQIRHQQTGEIIRQMPPEALIRLADDISQWTGKLMDISA
jgi:flagellar protein FlaG